MRLRNFIISVMVGTFVFLVLASATMVSAHTSDTALTKTIRGILFPGFICALEIGKAFSPSAADSPSMGALGLMMLVATILDIALYSFIVFIILGLARAVVSGPEAPAPPPKPLGDFVWRSAASIPIGFALTIALMGVWVVSGHWQGPDAPWFLPGFKIYARLLGRPGHSAGGLWVVLSGIFNVSFYSLIVYLLGRSFGIWRDVRSAPGRKPASR